MKSLFLSRLLREKVLLLGLLFIAIFIWGSHLMTSLKTWSDEMARTSAELQTQHAWLSQAATIEQRQKKAITNLEQTRSYDALRLQTEVSTLAAEAGLSSADVSTPKTASTPTLSIHSVTVQIRNISIGSIVTFYRSLSQRFPYIGIERCVITASRSDPKQVTLALDLTSVQINTPKK